MLLSVTCPTCGHKLAIPDNFSGELFRCKGCGSTFRVAAPATSPLPALPPPQDVSAPAGDPLPALAGSDPGVVRFSCPRCKAGFESPASQAGTKFHCSSCGQKIQVPAPPPGKTMLGTLAEADPRMKTTLGDVTPGGSPASGPGQLVPVVHIPPAASAPPGYPAVPPISININASASSEDRPPPRDEYRPRRRWRFRRPPPDLEVGPAGGAGMALGIVGMVLGIVAVTLSMFPCLGVIGLPLAGLGLLVSIIGLGVGMSNAEGNTGFAIAGLITSVVALVLALIWLIVVDANYRRSRWWWLQHEAVPQPVLAQQHGIGKVV
jgi:transcription elongation factor Elf1